MSNSVGHPCVLLAIDEDVKTSPADSKWKPQDMPRARYAGLFDPGQIPGLRPENRNRGDIVNYHSAKGTKAAVYLADGRRVFTTIEVGTQHAVVQEMP
jgi:hypothetical protein